MQDPGPGCGASAIHYCYTPPEISDIVEKNAFNEELHAVQDRLSVYEYASYMRIIAYFHLRVPIASTHTGTERWSPNSLLAVSTIQLLSSKGKYYILLGKRHKL